jgi:uncharacterized protein (DUF1501 family)
MTKTISRRDVLKTGGVIAVGLVTPAWLSAIAKADVLRAAGGGRAAKDTVLVVCQLSGGNDGLNTVVPYATKEYYGLRPTLAIPENEVLKIDERIGFHPAMEGLAGLYRNGRVAVIQGAGYPEPNRSHFKSMEIWQAACPESSLRNGWIGRHFDQQLSAGPLNPVVAIGLSTEKPRALNADRASIPCFASLADIQAMTGEPDMERLLRQIQGPDAPGGSPHRIVQQASRAALDAMAALRDRLRGFEPTQTYDDDAFGRGFRQIARLVATSPATRVVYFAAGGFDTHALQADQHARLMKGFSDAVAAFQAEMDALGRSGKVVVLVFSEFGRRTYENASQGTDHGAAAPMFLIGGGVRGGLYGPAPDLTDLEDGDLKFAIDFRQVYATALDRWLGGDSQKVLAGRFDHLPVFG